MKLRLSIFLIASLVISSCGGGGGGGGEPSTPSVPSASITMSISAPQIYISGDVTITWSTSNATSCTASGDWTGAKSLSGEETLSFTVAGQKSFTLTCQNSAGSETSRTVTSNVIGNAPVIVTGSYYLSSAELFLDLNSDYLLDDGEPTAVSINGNADLPDDPQDIISSGGTDDASGLDLLNLKLAAKSYDSEINQRVVTPVSYTHLTLPTRS